MAVIIRNCPHCPATRSTMTIRWQHATDDRHYIITATCAACQLPICFRVRERQGYGYAPMKEDRELERDKWEILNQWPVREELSCPAHVPLNVGKRFLEGEEAFARKSWNAAVAMYRSALDIATKAIEDVPQGQTFFKRLEWLHNEHRITPDMWAWANRVRIEGNEALHDPEEFSADDAKPLRLFTETFLKYVFELPGEVAAYRTETEEA